MATKLFNLTSTLVALSLLCLLGATPAPAIETVMYLHTDVAGSPVAATDANGNVIWRERYRPYGERINSQPASVSNRQFFHDKPFDQDSGLSYFGARYYDPVVGRFMGVDPKGFDENNLHSFNRYAYGNNNPYRFKDPNGRWAEDLVLAVPGIVVGSISLANNLKNGQFWSAAVDVAGLVADTVAAALPGVPGGAGLAIAATRGTASVAGDVANETATVQRWMSKGELEVTQETGLLRGGREGTHYVTDAANSDPLRARQRLALPQTPEVRVTMEVPKDALSAPSRVQPKFDMPGGGMERTATSNVPVRIIKMD